MTPACPSSRATRSEGCAPTASQYLHSDKSSLFELAIVNDEALGTDKSIYQQEPEAQPGRASAIVKPDLAEGG